MTHMELAHRLVLLAIPLLVGGCLSGSADEATESGAQPDILLGEEDAVDAPDTEDPVVPATVVMVPAPIAEDSPPARGDDDEPDSPPPVTASPERR